MISCANKLCKEIIFKILELDCNPKQINNKGETALYHAIKNKYDKEIIDKIKEKMLI